MVNKRLPSTKMKSHFNGNFPNLSINNSTVIQGRVVYIGQKDVDGNKTTTYAAYDYKTKLKLGVHIDGKEALIKFLEKQDFSEIEGVA